MLCNTPNAIKKGIAYYEKYADQLLKEIAYYAKFKKGKQFGTVAEEANHCIDYIRDINQMCRQYAQVLGEEYKPLLELVIEKTTGY